MITRLNRFGVTALASLALLGLCGGQARAQAVFRVGDPSAGNQPAPNTWCGAGLTAPNTGYYGNPYVWSPTGASLSGAADVINAQGQLVQQLEQSKIIKEQAEQAKLDTKRKAYDQWLYERATRPSIEDDREQAYLESIRRARHDPPLAEIWTGKALNDLLKTLQKSQAQGIQGPSVLLEEGILKHINVSAGTSAGSLGILTNANALKWPYVLKGAAYKKDRDAITELAPQAVQQAGSGEVDEDTLRGLGDSVNRLLASLKRNVAEIEPNDYIRAKRYLNQLDTAVAALKDPNVAKSVNRKWVGKETTVASLVAQMTRDGVRFAAANEGDQPAYTALHSAMVTYDNYVGPQTRQPTPK
jgi:hypothetical protein